MVEQTDEEIKKITVSTGKRDIVAALKVLSDKDRQYDLWMNIKTPGMSSLEEEQHALFDGLDRVKFKIFQKKHFPINYVQSYLNLNC